MFFDNLQLIHSRGPILEETHYYPFGLTMAGISSKAQSFGNPENKFEYNGIEFETDLELLTYDAFYRELNPQIGVWLQVDPKIEQNMENWGTYVSNFDNPIKFKDPKGDCPTCEEIWDEFKSAAKETAKSIKENAVAFYIGAGNVARSINEFNPLANLVEVITGNSTSSDFTQPKPRSMSTADLGVNTLMLFGGGAARALSLESKISGGSMAAAASQTNATKGISVIGPRSVYRDYAKKIGANFLNVSDKEWTLRKNVEFLQAVIKRGDDVLFAGKFDPAKIDPKSILAQEIKFLEKYGYTWSKDFTRLTKTK